MGKQQQHDHLQDGQLASNRIELRIVTNANAAIASAAAFVALVSSKTLRTNLYLASHRYTTKSCRCTIENLHHFHSVRFKKAKAKSPTMYKDSTMRHEQIPRFLEKSKDSIAFTI
ncbi:hypothetical protein V6N11_064567 [Hibiscus sabdariffa]|uniref:Uncharacterized protein n=1 Tax=Hibiscus sabdariffa TaxID=183260 RepID=A0ABR2ND36_9ROSI